MRGICQRALGFVAIMLLGACASGTGDTPTEPGLGVLAGRTFVSMGDTTGPGGEPLVRGTKLKLTFSEDSVSAGAGCNSMSGPASVVDGVLVLSGRLATTEMGCDPTRMAQDQWVAELLSAEPKLAIATTNLTLDSTGLVVTLTDLDLLEPTRRSSTLVGR